MFQVVEFCGGHSRIQFSCCVQKLSTMVHRPQFCMQKNGPLQHSPFLPSQCYIPSGLGVPPIVRHAIIPCAAPHPFDGSGVNTTAAPPCLVLQHQPYVPLGCSWTPKPVLQNIVSTVNLGTPLDLRKIALQARNIEYNPKRFGAAVLRIRSPRTTALLFSSGKMVITGAKSQELSREAGRKFARLVQKLGFDTKFSNFKIQNIVACVNVNFNIRLEGVALMHFQFSTYEPELFPGIVYRMVKPRVVLLIFSTGKVVITGAQTEEDITLAFRNIYPLLKMFDKGE